MEERKITVVPTTSHVKKTIMSSAETLGQLKEDFTKAGIDYADMTFYEGLTKTELNHDDSLLPRNINYKGTVTNDLVFMLTYANKKIKSGVDRQHIYEVIKSNGLQGAVKEAFGKNFTMVKTVDLVDFIKGYNGPIMDMGCCTTSNLTKSEDTDKESKLELAEAVISLVKDYLLKYTAESLHKDNKKAQIKCPYTDVELDSMFSDLTY